MKRVFQLVPLLGLLILPGCRALTRPNPQLPPEMQREGPTAAAASGRTAPVQPASARVADRDGGAATPQPAPHSTTPSVTTSSSSGTAVALPSAPPLSEGKSGRLLLEALPDRQYRELAPLPSNPEFRKALREWDRGPVRFIILKAEQDLYRRLETDEDRMWFIQDFWARRDRSPETPDNEYRQEFWRRVAEADRRFIDAPVQGWKTDRGRILILLGPPDQKETFRMRSKGADIERWVYRNRPNLFLEPNFYVAFRFIFGAGWELSNDPRDFDPVFRDLRANVRALPRSVGPEALFPGVGTEIKVPVITPLNLFLDLGQAMTPPELYRLEEKRGNTVVETTQVFGAMDVRTSFEFLGAVGDKVRTGVVVGILKGSLVSESDVEEADANLKIEVSVYPEEDETSEDVVRLRRFGPSRENYVVPATGRLLFRAESPLAPGRHLAVYRILDETSGQAAQARETFTVPDRFGQGLTLSTVILAQKLVELDPSVERPDAFTLGRFRVVPTLDATYRNGETLAFFFTVDGASLDPRTGRRRLDVEYQFAVQQGTKMLELGDSLLYRDQENPQGWSVPLVDWPPASYRLTIKVTDVVTGESTENSAFFRVVPGG